MTRQKSKISRFYCNPILFTRSKKATTSGANAAIIIGVIAAALIMYIIFLPETEREKILEAGEIGSKEVFPENVLLQKHVGRLSYHGMDTISHHIPSFHIFESRESIILHKYNPFMVKKGWFTNQFKEISFSFDDFENTENIFLAFDAPNHKGVLKILLNGRLIYEYDTKISVVKPVLLEKAWLKPKDNFLEIKVSSTGLRFWDTNTYSIDNLRIIGDITDVSRQIAKNIFSVDPVEMDNLVLARLSFLPRCDPNSIGTLNIKINNELVYSAIPDCDSVNIQDIDESVLNEGKNTIFFQTKKGDYYLDSIKLVVQQKGSKSLIEYFEVDEDMYGDVQDDVHDIILEVEFVDNNKRKRGKINVNGHLASFDQETHLYSKDISNWIEEGAKNYVEILPETTLDIPEIRVIVD